MVRYRLRGLLIDFIQKSYTYFNHQCFPNDFYRILIGFDLIKYLFSTSYGHFRSHLRRAQDRLAIILTDLAGQTVKFR